MDILNFLTGQSIGIYFFIFFGKIIEVAFNTIRHVLVNRGERIKGTVLGFFEIIIWVVVTGTVLAGFTQDIIKVAVFCVAFAVGIYLGSFVEQLLAFGLSTVEVIISDECTYDRVFEYLKQNKIAFTKVNGEGIHGRKWVMKLHIKRNKLVKTVRCINKISDKCVISISDLKSMYGGFIKK